MSDVTDRFHEACINNVYGPLLTEIFLEDKQQTLYRQPLSFEQVVSSGLLSEFSLHDKQGQGRLPC